MKLIIRTFICHQIRTACGGIRVRSFVLPSIRVTCTGLVFTRYVLCSLGISCSFCRIHVSVRMRKVIFYSPFAVCMPRSCTTSAGLLPSQQVGTFALKSHFVRHHAPTPSGKMWTDKYLVTDCTNFVVVLNTKCHVARIVFEKIRATVIINQSVSRDCD